MTASNPLPSDHMSTCKMSWSSVDRSTATQNPEYSTTILLADPDINIRKRFEQLLNNEKYQTVSATTCQECLDFWQIHQPFLMLLDANFFTDCCFMNNKFINEADKIILLFSSHENDDLFFSIYDKVANYFLKPMDDSLLLNQIRRYTGEHQQRNWLHEMQLQLREVFQEQSIEVQQMDLKVHTLINSVTHSDRIRKNLIRNLNHDIRTQLFLISTSAELLGYLHTDKQGGQAEKLLENIQSGIEAITGVLNNLNLFSAIDSNTIKLEPTSVDLADYCLKLIAEKKSTVGQKHRITFTHEYLDISTVMIDLVLWRQVLTELLNNAIRFSPGGGRIHISIYREAKNIYLQVQDEGIGIPDIDQKNVFEEFFRASNADSIAGTPGSGIGLTIVQQIISLCQGDISLRSEINKGTVITVSFPFVSATKATHRVTTTSRKVL